MLETHLFKNSRRYPALLRFIVEETLAGRGEYLKERLLGIRVFDRPADYDTAADPVVRVTIAEIRKRIAQYYHDEEHDPEIRIELLPGRYAPEFRPAREFNAERLLSSDQVRRQLTAADRTPYIAPDETPALPLHEDTSPGIKRSGWFTSKAAYLAGIPALILILGALPLFRWMRPTALEQMWNPILASGQAVLFCLPTGLGRHADEPGSPPGASAVTPARLALSSDRAAGTTFLDHEHLGENVVYSDMLATLKITDMLALHHREYQVRLNVSTTLGDLKQGPTVLIGGLDNPWTMRAVAPLRFHFAGSDEESYWIADSKDPSNRSWSLDLKQQYATVNRDYAIVARLHNEQTGQPQVIVAGIGMSGTAAAGEFLGDAGRLEELRHRIGQDFRDKDFEVVLSTDVVNGIAGSAKILAVAVW